MTMTRCAAAALVAAAVGVCLGADPVADALATPLTATWTGLPLRAAAERLAELGGAAVVVDRRIDPETRVAVDAASEPLAVVLAHVSHAAGAAVARYAGHLRIVPPDRAGGLAAAAAARNAELRALTPRLRTMVQAEAAWSWPEGAVPRDLVAAAAAQAGITIVGLDELPHDHFPAARLPALALCDRIDLLLAHFDRRVEWKPRAARGRDATLFALVPIPVADAAAPPPPARPTSAPPPRPPAATYSLTVAAPLDELLATLARRFTLELDLDRTALAQLGVAPGEIVRLDLRNVTRDQLLDAVLEPRGLGWRIDGGRLSVSAAAP